MDRKQKKRENVLKKELLAVEKQESKLLNAAINAKPIQWKANLESMIPPKVYTGLESAFCKGFSVVFSQGRGLIEKTYAKTSLQEDFSIRDFAARVKGGKKELKQLQKSAAKSDLVNLAVTTVEGIGLGALGIGMPDIVLFLSTLLKGIYETALNYGFDYCQSGEQMLILKMMEAALQTGQKASEANAQVEMAMRCQEVTKEELDAQMQKTAAAFAMDMLLLKFVQGLPIVGIIGGAANPVYYRKILKYVQLKYRKRYLTKLQQEQTAKCDS